MPPGGPEIRCKWQTGGSSPGACLPLSGAPVLMVSRAVLCSCPQGRGALPTLGPFTGLSTPPVPPGFARPCSGHWVSSIPGPSLEPTTRHVETDLPVMGKGTVETAELGRGQAPRSMGSQGRGQGPDYLQDFLTNEDGTRAGPGQDSSRERLEPQSMAPLRGDRFWGSAFQELSLEHVA